VFREGAIAACSNFSDSVLTSGRSSARVLLAAVVLAGLNLRTVFASLPPLLDDVRADLGLSAGVAGLLTTGPVVCFGLFAPFAPRLARRVAIEKLLVALALLTTLGTGARGLGGTGALFAGTLLAGFAVAIAQALVPILVRVRVPARVGVLTGGFSMALVFGASVAAGLAVPLQHLLGSWQAALAAFAVPAGLAALVWLVPVREKESVLEHAPALGLHRLHGSWSIALFFGLQSMAFYTGLTWLPSVLEAHGFSEAAAGGLQALSSGVQIVPAFLVPVLAGRRRTQTGVLATLVVLGVVAIAGLLAAPGAAVVWMVVLGLAQGGALGLALVLPVLRGRSGHAVAALTPMALSVGYLLASAGPFLAGLAHDATGGWTLPLLFMIGITAAELPAGIPACRKWTVGGT
jgi:MFS transporter, CP family, cyanate transporter